MSAEYDLYISDHVQNVKRAYDWLTDHFPDIKTDMDAHEDILAEHDKSKYSKEEYDAYDAYFYGGNRSYQVKQDFNRAWLHHIHNNPHHWQYWILVEDDPTTEEPILIEMPLWYAIEMVCDWWTFSFRSEDLREIFSWYADHEKTIKLHPKTRKYVEKLLGRINEVLDDEERRF